MLKIHLRVSSTLLSLALTEVTFTKRGERTEMKARFKDLGGGGGYYNEVA